MVKADLHSYSWGLARNRTGLHPAVSQHPDENRWDTPRRIHGSESASGRRRRAGTGAGDRRKPSLFRGVDFDMDGMGMNE